MRSSARVLSAILAGFLGLGLSVEPHVAGAAGPLAHVTAAWVAITANQTPVMLAKEGGYFEAQGLDVDLRHISGSVTAVSSLLSGEVQVVQVAGAAVVAARVNGAPVKMVAGFVNKPVFIAMTTAAIQRPEQLRGTTWATTRIGNADYFSLVAMLRHFGLSAEAVTVINTGNTPGQIAAVVGGHAQGILVSPPNNVLAEKAGLHVFFDTSVLGDEQNVGLAVTDGYARDHPEVVRGFIRACIAGIHRFMTDRPFAERVMRTYLKYTDPDVLAAGWTYYTRLFTKAPYPSVPGILRVIDEVATLQPNAASVRPGDVIDQSFVAAIEKSGFIERTYER